MNIIVTSHARANSPSKTNNLEPTPAMENLPSIFPVVAVCAVAPQTLFFHFHTHTLTSQTKDQAFFSLTHTMTWRSSWPAASGPHSLFFFQLSI